MSSEDFFTKIHTLVETLTFFSANHSVINARIQVLSDAVNSYIRAGSSILYTGQRKFVFSILRSV